jgi:hypothetical protein
MTKKGLRHISLNIFTVIILFLIVLSVITVVSASVKDYNFNFMSFKALGRSDLQAQGYGTKFWTLSSDTGNIDYSKDFWMPIESWEYTVCSRGLSTQLTENGVSSAGVGSSSPSGIYADAFSVAAYQRYSDINSTDSNTTDEFLYEITWYFQPAMLNDNGYYYYVNLTGPDGNKELLVKGEASRKTGSSGYDAFYSTAKYTKVILYYANTPHAFPIVSVNDTNR